MQKTVYVGFFSYHLKKIMDETEFKYFKKKV